MLQLGMRCTWFLLPQLLLSVKEVVASAAETGKEKEERVHTVTSCPLAAGLLGKLTVSLRSKLEDRGFTDCLKSDGLDEWRKVTCFLEALSPEKSAAKAYHSGDRTSGTGYGELNITGLLSLWDAVADFGAPLGSKDVFADLGSGRSRSVVQTFLCTDVKESVGIELVEERHKIGAYMQMRLAKALKASPEYAAKTLDRELVVLEGSFVEEKQLKAWSGATAVLANSLLFPPEVMHQLRGLILGDALPLGGIVFTSRPFPGCRNDKLKRFGIVRADSTWTRDAMLHVYVRWPSMTALPNLPAGSSEATCLEKFPQLLAHLKVRLCRSIKLVENGLNGTKDFPFDGRCAWTEWKHLSQIDDGIRETGRGGFAAFKEETPWATVRDDLLGLTIMHHAAKSGADAKTIGALVEAGADVSSLSDVAQTPLHMATGAETVQALLAAKANLEALDKFKRRPLHAAAEKAPVEVVEELLKSKAIVEQKEGGGNSLLHLAARRKGKDAIPVVEKLLQAGCNPNLKDLVGKKAVDDAREPEVIELLRQAMAKQSSSKKSEEL